MTGRRSRRASPGQLSLGLVDDPIAIRSLLIDQLRRKQVVDRLVPEMGICQRHARIDLASIGDRLDGYEIKSARDDLRRLPSQAALYGRVFDRLTLVAPSAQLKAGSRLVPDWWGLALVDAGARSIETVRDASANPQPDLLATARLLWREEAATLLQTHLGHQPGVPRPVLWRQLVDVMSPPELRAAVCGCLMNRPAWRAAG